MPVCVAGRVRKAVVKEGFVDPTDPSISFAQPKSGSKMTAAAKTAAATDLDEDPFEDAAMQKPTRKPRHRGRASKPAEPTKLAIAGNVRYERRNADGGSLETANLRERDNFNNGAPSIRHTLAACVFDLLHCSIQV